MNKIRREQQFFSGIREELEKANSRNFDGYPSSAEDVISYQNLLGALSAYEAQSIGFLVKHSEEKELH